MHRLNRQIPTPKEKFMAIKFVFMTFLIYFMTYISYISLHITLHRRSLRRHP